MKSTPSIHLFGVVSVAQKYVYVAKQLIHRLSMRKEDVCATNLTLPDGSYVDAKRIDDLYVAVIVGVVSEVIPQVEPKKKFEKSKILAGLVTNPTLSTIASAILGGAATPAIKEFTASKSSYKEVAGQPRSRVKEPRLITPVPASFKTKYNVLHDAYAFESVVSEGFESLKPFTEPNSFTGTTTVAQTGVIVPSMFSGAMQEIVQLALSYVDTTGVSATIEYGCFYHYTFGAVEDNNGTFWFLKVDPTGVWIAAIPKIPIDELPKDLPLAYAEKITKFGGLPTGKAPTSWTQVLEPEKLTDYINCQPMIDELYGWSINNDGSEWYNVGYFIDSLGQWFTRLFKLSLEFNEYNEGSIDVTVETEERIAAPSSWSRELPVYADWILNPSVVGKFDRMDDYYDAYPNHPIFKNYVKEYEGARMHSIQFSNILESSWNKKGVMCAVHRLTGAGKGIQGYVIPPLTMLKPNPDEISTIDAIFHVFFVKGEFHFVSFYWQYQCLQGNKYLPDMNLLPIGVRGITEGENGYAAITGVWGTPPTLYSNKVDRRTTGPSHVHVSWVDTAVADSFRNLPNNFAAVPSEYYGDYDSESLERRWSLKVQWPAIVRTQIEHTATHVAGVAPFMSRNEFLMVGSNNYNEKDITVNAAEGVDHAAEMMRTNNAGDNNFTPEPGLSRMYSICNMEFKFGKPTYGPPTTGAVAVRQIPAFVTEPHLHYVITKAIDPPDNMTQIIIDQGDIPVSTDGFEQIGYLIRSGPSFSEEHLPHFTPKTEMFNDPEDSFLEPMLIRTPFAITNGVANYPATVRPLNVPTTLFRQMTDGTGYIDFLAHLWIEEARHLGKRVLAERVPFNINVLSFERPDEAIPIRNTINENYWFYEMRLAQRGEYLEGNIPVKDLSFGWFDLNHNPYLPGGPRSAVPKWTLDQAIASVPEAPPYGGRQFAPVGLGEPVTYIGPEFLPLPNWWVILKPEIFIALYSEGIPDEYIPKDPSIEDVTKLTWGVSNDPIVNGPTAGSSYIGEPFGFWKSVRPTNTVNNRGEVISFGSIPGGLVLDPLDIICPVGIMENG